MLTVAYCRVSTEEQAAEGFSIEGQATKLRDYARILDLGEVVVIDDPGISGKNLERPGIERIREMIADGHVSHVLVWRLDRLSRNLGDLILLADEFGKANVGLVSLSENLDLTSAAGRMFYNILGTFAQFYREQLAENVTLGMDQARRQGIWVNRPPTGYDLVDGVLIPNGQADQVRRAFRLRGMGKSQAEVADATGIKRTTIHTILNNRAYLGEMRHKDQWLPSRHEPLITDEEWRAAHRGRTKGVKRGKDLLSGRVHCGMCGRRQSIMGNGKGQWHYRCRHHGDGCDQPARSNRGLLKAFVLALSLLGEEELRNAVRRDLEHRRQPGGARRRRAPGTAERLAELRRQREKLLALHYGGHISAEQFGEEQARITAEIEGHEAEALDLAKESAMIDDLSLQFEEVAAFLDEADLDTLWSAANDDERRVLVDELLEAITVYPDRLQVTIIGAPPLNIAFDEVGLKSSALAKTNKARPSGTDSKFVGVGGGT